MIVKREKHYLLVLLILILLCIQACVQPTDSEPEITSPKPRSGELPTWTPRAGDTSALPTATRTASATPISTNTPAATSTPNQITFSVQGGNLNIRRGPSLAYNYVGVLYDGDVAIAVGRDRISRWLMIKLPNKPDERGWVTTETQYSNVTGDVSSLPFVEVEPAEPGFIRNCTNHEMLILPAEINLLPKAQAPDNEERFDVGYYQVIDVDAGYVHLDDVRVAEGRTVDILHDGAGGKSKCE